MNELFLQSILSFEDIMIIRYIIFGYIKTVILINLGGFGIGIKNIYNLFLYIWQRSCIAVILKGLTKV